MYDFLHPAPRHETFPTVWFEAWKYDKEEALWAALVLEILAQVRSQVGWCRWARIWLNLYWQRLDRARMIGHFARFLVPALGIYLLGLILAYVYTWVSSISWNQLAPYAWITGTFALIAPALQALYQGLRAALPFDFKAYIHQPDYQTRIGFLAEFERDFAHVVAAITQNGRWPLVVFIDDLDRCTPPKPVEIIEAINHLIDAKHCVFIIGMDEHMIVKSIEAKYAQLLDTVQEPGGRTLGTYFLEKIIQLQFRIPPLEERRLIDYVDKLLGPTKIPEKPKISTETQRQEVQQATEAIQAERRMGVGVTNLDKALQAAKRRRPEFSSEIWEQAKKEVEIRFVESPQVREAIYHALPYLGGNPRQVKRFINAFRLQTMLSRRLALIQDTLEDLNLQAQAVITWMRWPVLAKMALADTATLVHFHQVCRQPQDTSAKETLPALLHPLVEKVEIRTFFQRLQPEQIARFQRLLGTAKITAHPETPPQTPSKQPHEQSKTSESP